MIKQAVAFGVCCFFARHKIDIIEQICQLEKQTFFEVFNWSYACFCRCLLLIGFIEPFFASLFPYLSERKEKKKQSTWFDADRRRQMFCHWKSVIFRCALYVFLDVIFSPCARKSIYRLNKVPISKQLWTERFERIWTHIDTYLQLMMNWRTRKLSIH